MLFHSYMAKNHLAYWNSVFKSALSKKNLKDGHTVLVIEYNTTLGYFSIYTRSLYPQMLVN